MTFVPENAPTLDASFGRLWGCDNQHIDSGAGLFAFERTISDEEKLAALWLENDRRLGLDADEVRERAVCVTGSTTHALRSVGSDASEDGTGRGTPIIVNARQDDPLTYGDNCGPLDTDGSTYGVKQNWRVRRLTPVECSRLQGFPDNYLEMNYADAEEAHSAQILHELWRKAGAPKTQEQERTGVAASLLTPEVLLSGVYGGWLSWEMALRCASGGGAISGADDCLVNLMPGLRKAWQGGCSPYRRESFEQFSRELGLPVSRLPLEEASARALLRRSRLWPKAQGTWPLRYAFTAKGSRSLSSDSSRYAALGNSMAVPVLKWIGQRIELVERLLGAA